MTKLATRQAIQLKCYLDENHISVLKNQETTGIGRSRLSRMLKGESGQPFTEKELQSIAVAYSLVIKDPEQDAAILTASALTPKEQLELVNALSTDLRQRLEERHPELINNLFDVCFGANRRKAP